MSWKELMSQMSSDQKRQFTRTFGPSLARNTDDLIVFMNTLKPKPKVKRRTPRYRRQQVQRRTQQFRNAYLETV